MPMAKMSIFAVIINSDRNIMETDTNPEEWQRECERVSTRFKTMDKGDIREWRTHLEQAKVYSEVNILS